MDYRHPLEPIAKALERKFSWAAFPGPIRILVLFQVAVALLTHLLGSGYAELLYLDKEKILAGQVWRLITFLFVADVWIVFLIFFMFIMWMINDGLEEAWGTFRVNLYLFCTWLGMVAAAWLMPAEVRPWMTGIETLILYSSLFLAFATLFPKHEILFMLILPVQVRWLALINGAILLKLLFDVLRIPGMTGALASLPVVLGMTPYLVVFVPRILHGLAHRQQASARRSRFAAGQLPEGDAFHTCASCGKTDVEDAEAEFRVGTDGEEYCTDCLEPASKDS